MEFLQNNLYLSMGFAAITGATLMWGIPKMYNLCKKVLTNRRNNELPVENVPEPEAELYEINAEVAQIFENTINSSNTGVLDPNILCNSSIGQMIPENIQLPIKYIAFNYQELINTYGLLYTTKLLQMISNQSLIANQVTWQGLSTFYTQIYTNIGQNHPMYQCTYEIAQATQIIVNSTL